MRAPVLPMVALLAGACATTGRAADAAADRRVVLVTVDGTRWQEVFRGADEALVPRDAGETRARFVRPTPDESRRALLPFLWGVVARQGQLIGNRDRGSQVLVGNPHRSSYPGYHELLCGFSSPAIKDNRKVPNPDPTVFEWLSRAPAFLDRVAIFASWGVFDAIFGGGRAGILVDVGAPTAAPGLIERLRAETPPPWGGSVYDAFVFHAAMAHLADREPRALYLSLGDTDEWAHAGRYDRYLDSLHRSDAWLAELWRKLESLVAYRGRTSLLVTTDHGRGETAETWREHGAAVVGADQAWVAVLGPGAPAAGERGGHAPVTLAQVAATVGALVGADFRAAVPAAAEALPLRSAR